MKEKINRRDFLRLAGIGAAGILLHPEMKAEAKTPELTFDQVASLAIRLNRISNKLREHPLGIEPSQKVMEEWIDEIVPQFAAMTDKPVLPTDFKFENFTDPFKYGHVLGYSTCGDEMRVNARMDNPLSTWYESEYFWGTITHETAHEEQGETLCRVGLGEQVESSAQVAMLEVTAALAISGNKIAIHSFVTELFDIATSAAWAMAIEHPEKYAQGYKWLRNQIDDTPLKRARTAKTEEAWAGDEFKLMQILVPYNLYPLQAINDARNSDGVVKNQIMPHTEYSIWDTLYLIDHLEEIVSSL